MVAIGDSCIWRGYKSVGSGGTFLLPAYTINTNGIITSWCMFNVWVYTATAKLKVFRNNGSQYVFVGESPAASIVGGPQGALNSGLPANITVQAGDFLGLYVSRATVINCGQNYATNFKIGVDVTTTQSSGYYNAFTLMGTTSLQAQLQLTDITINCPVGFTFLTQDTAGRTLLEWSTFSSPSTIQTHYNATAQKYETHKTSFDFDETKTVPQKEGVGLYFNTPTTITLSTLATPSITLKTGWNLVSNWGMVDRTLGALKTSIGAEATSASYFNKTTQTFQTDDATIVPAMEAFFVNVSGDVVWAG